VHINLAGAEREMVHTQVTRIYVHIVQTQRPCLYSIIYTYSRGGLRNQ
jgi:hypothetical protein